MYQRVVFSKVQQCTDTSCVTATINVVHSGPCFKVHFRSMTALTAVITLVIDQSVAVLLFILMMLLLLMLLLSADHTAAAAAATTAAVVEPVESGSVH
jgi:hypothetical protein